jgi:hypothetical protein
MTSQREWATPIVTCFAFLMLGGCAHMDMGMVCSVCRAARGGDGGAMRECGLRLAEVHAGHAILERNGARETLAWRRRKDPRPRLRKRHSPLPHKPHNPLLHHLQNPLPRKRHNRLLHEADDPPVSGRTMIRRLFFQMMSPSLIHGAPKDDL